VLDEFLRDLLSIAGVAVSVLGTLATLLGLYYAILQIRKTASAAQAASEAAKNTLEESQRNFHNYAIANANRFVNEAKIHIENGHWERAAVRLNDLADQGAQLVSNDEGWADTVAELRDWGNICLRLKKEEIKRFPTAKWLLFLQDLQAKIDSRYGPFAPRGVPDPYAAQKEQIDDLTKKVRGRRESRESPTEAPGAAPVEHEASALDDIGQGEKGQGGSDERK
jgi:hypothetical protein